ncbi:alpha-N-acetylgalactosaminide alpha-2,6-sialyltransferase 3 [Ambystoma mexicanum]|uniref:alpha-N-acetylgalactosaminide alpha-2,6-sialyltransferase 3 n=1 Tax=Ambystoma mexicanum TaxID=8296 RepID=UPI0037E92934
MEIVRKRKARVALTLTSLFALLLVLHLKSEQFEVKFLVLLKHLGLSGARWLLFHDQERHPTNHKGYINLETKEPLHLDCDQCAIVSNSGQMTGQKIGNVIDQSTCVWRMNNAPVHGYEDDVGHRTSIRVVSHTSVPYILKNPDYFFKETNNTIYVIWGPYRNMRTDGKGIVYSMLKKTVANYPEAKIYLTTEEQMRHCDEVFKIETGRDR